MLSQLPPTKVGGLCLDYESKQEVVMVTLLAGVVVGAYTAFAVAQH